MNGFNTGGGGGGYNYGSETNGAGGSGLVVIYIPGLKLILTLESLPNAPIGKKVHGWESILIAFVFAYIMFNMTWKEMVQEQGFNYAHPELKSLNSDGSIENDDGIGFDSNKIGEIFFDSRYKTPLNIAFMIMRCRSDIWV